MSDKKCPSNCRLALTVLLGCLVIAAIALYFGVIRGHKVLPEKPIKIDGIFLNSPRVDIAPFHLLDTQGQPFTRDSLKGHWSFLFFGFTNCGFVCPTTMAALKGMTTQLEKTLPENKMPRVIFISVDPDRDSIEKIKQYVTAFNPHFIGVRADIAETVALEHQLHIAAAKIQADGNGKNNYTINHSAEILVFNPDGNLQAFLSYPHTAEGMAKDYQAILNATNFS